MTTKQEIINKILDKGKKDWWCWACGQNPCDDDCNDKDFSFDESIVIKMLNALYDKCVIGGNSVQ